MSIATVKGGYWGELFGSYTPISSATGKNPTLRGIARRYRRLRALREIAETLNGVVAGSTALATHTRVKAVEAPNEEGQVGGVRTIETVTDVNRATTAADVAEILADVLSYPLAPTTYPTNKDGNPRQYPGG
jgi:hypothetical protein